MSLYIGLDGDIRELPDDLVSAWGTAQNPKFLQWTLLPPRPTPDAQWIDGAWHVPTPPVPESVSARQIRLWLVRQGISLAAVDTAIDSIPDALTRDSVRVEWEYAPYVERTHPMLVPLAQMLGLTETQVDQAFQEAALI